MPKAILKFDLLEEREEFKIASRAGDYYSALYDMDQELRGKIKYAPDTATEAEIKIYEELRETLHRIMSNYGVEF